MLEINVNVTVHAPEIAALLERMTGTEKPTEKPVEAPSVAPERKEAKKGMDTLPEKKAPPAATTAPVTPVPTAPVSEIPTYTLERVARAGADLMTSRPEIRPQLFALLANYGVKSVQDIPSDKLGAFATELRGLGGKL